MGRADYHTSRHHPQPSRHHSRDHEDHDSRYRPAGPELDVARRRSKQHASTSDGEKQRRRKENKSEMDRRSDPRGKYKHMDSGRVLKREPTGLSMSEIKDTRQDEDESYSRRRRSKEVREGGGNRSEEWDRNATRVRSSREERRKYSDRKEHRQSRREVADDGLSVSTSVSNSRTTVASHSFTSAESGSTDGTGHTGRKTSISNSRSVYSEATPAPHAKPSRTKSYSRNRSDSSRANTGHGTETTPRMNNLRVDTAPKSHRSEMTSLPEDRSTSSNVSLASSWDRSRPPRPSAPPGKLPTTPSSNVAFMEGMNNIERKSSKKDRGETANASKGSNQESFGSGLMKFFRTSTGVSSITGTLDEKPSEVDYGIDPTRGSFDLVIVPKNGRQRRSKGSPSKSRSKEVAMEAAESIVAESIAASASVAETHGSYLTKDLAKWSSLSVKAAMAVIQHKGGEKMAQRAANVVLEEGRRRNPLEVNKLATKVSVAVLEAGGDHKVAAAVAVAIMGGDDDDEKSKASKVSLRSRKSNVKSSGESVKWSIASVSQAGSHNEPDIVPTISKDWLKSDKSSVKSIASMRSKSTRSHKDLPLEDDATTQSETKSMASKRRHLKAREKQIEARNRALEEATSAIERERGQTKVAGPDANKKRAAEEVKRLELQKKEEELERRNRDLEMRLQALQKGDDPSITSTIASKQRHLQEKEAEIAERNRALEEAAQANLRREREIRERMAALDMATRAVESTTLQREPDRHEEKSRTRDDEKRRQLREMEEDVARRDRELEEAARTNEAKERELAERMAALDAATAALLARANNVQQEIDDRRSQSGGGVAHGLEPVHEGREFRKADNIRVAPGLGPVHEEMEFRDNNTFQDEAFEENNHDPPFDRHDRGEFAVSSPSGPPPYQPQHYQFNQPSHIPPQHQFDQSSHPQPQDQFDQPSHLPPPGQEQQQPLPQQQQRENKGNMFERFTDKLIGMFDTACDSSKIAASPEDTHTLTASRGEMTRSTREGYSQDPSYLTSHHTPSRYESPTASHLTNEKNGRRSEYTASQNSATNRALNQALEQALGMNAQQNRHGSPREESFNATGELQRDESESLDRYDMDQWRSQAQRHAGYGRPNDSASTNALIEASDEALNVNSTQRAGKPRGRGPVPMTRTGSLKQKLKVSFLNSFKKVSSQKAITQAPANGNGKVKVRAKSSPSMMRLGSLRSSSKKKKASQKRSKSLAKNKHATSDPPDTSKALKRGQAYSFSRKGSKLVEV